MTLSRWCPLALALCVSGLLLLIPLPSEAACFHTHPNMAGMDDDVDNPGTLNPDGTCTGGYNPNLSPNHYAALYFDIKNKNADPVCAQSALAFFQRKLATNLEYAERGGIVCSIEGRVANPFQAWLWGASIASIYRTGIEALDQGYAVDDTLLQRVREQHRSFASPQDLNCGSGPGAGGNTCMDDYAVTAVGYAWVAAYEARMGRTAEAVSWAARAQEEIHRALKPVNENGSICFYRKGTNNPARCDAGFTELDAGAARVIGANHGQESPSYGFGLMSSIAFACRGLQVARQYGLQIPSTGCAAFNTDQLRIARELLLEARQKTFFVNGEWVFKPTACFHIGDLSTAHCGELSVPGDPNSAPVYSPLDAPLKRFYDAMGITTFPISSVVTDTPRKEGNPPHTFSPGPGPAFQFDQVDPRLFTDDPTAFFGPLRRLFYVEETFERWPEPTPQASVYWIQTAERAGFGDPGTLTVAGGASRENVPVKMWWRDASTPGSAFVQVPNTPLPDPAGAPWKVWYNSVPGPIDRDRHYEVRVQQGNGPFSFCSYLGRQIPAPGQEPAEQIWWCQPPVARFEASCSGTLCTFEDRVSPPEGNVASWSWVFGDGANGSGATASHDYSTGTYFSRLTVTDSAGQTATTGQQIFAGTAPLDPHISASCTDRSCTFDTIDPRGFETWFWSFGDGVSGYANATTTHNYASSGTFTVRLTVTKGGQSASTVRHIAIDLPPSAGFTSTCTGRSCTFNPNGSSDDLALAARVWDFGDGTTASSVRLDHTIDHRYTANGTYTVRLTVYDSRGQQATTTRTVTVSDQPPTASFTSSCSGRTCSFDGRGSTDDLGVTSWSWSFGDGATGSGSQRSHTYAANGTYSVQLTVADASGQTNSTSRTVTVSDQPPTARFTASCSGRTCSFDGRGSTDDIGISSYSWSFGDGATGSGSQTSRAYAASGTYTVRLTVSDTGGQTHSTTRNVTPNLPPTATFTVSCSGRTCDVDATGSTDDLGISSYGWSFGDGQSGSGPTAQHFYSVDGTYTITVTVTDSTNQTSSTTRTVSVVDYPPSAEFYVVCVDRTCYADSESSGDDNGITFYTWTWGDGQTTSGASATAPSHTYAAYGNYTVTLTVRDAAHQTATVSHTAYAALPPVASFTIDCIGRSCDVDASASSSTAGIASYDWSWGDESSTSTTVPTAHHDYAFDDTFTVTLRITDNAGNTAFASRTVSLVDYPPYASFYLSCVGRACYADSESSGDDLGIVHYAWTWGDGATTSGAGITAPSHTYAANGTYTVTLTVTDAAGQTSFASLAVTVDQAPTASFTIECAGRICDVNASASSDDVGIVSYLWDWGDERVTSTTAQTAQHDYFYDGVFTVVLTVFDARGNAGRAERTIDTAGGSALSASYAPTCSMLDCQFDASDSTASPSVESYHWDWGDGERMPGSAAERHAFATPGEYTVTLTVADSLGRTAQFSKRLTVRADGSRRHTPGAARLDTPVFRLRATNDPDSPTSTAAIAGAKGTPIAGDWNGDGSDSIGRYDPATSTFRLRNSNHPGPAELTFVFGAPGAGWLPLAGDWNGDGSDSVGLYDPQSGTFYLRNSNSSGEPDLAFGFLEFGAGWRPVAGDWDGDGVDTVGLYDPTTGGFYLRTTNTTGIGADLVFIFVAPGPEQSAPLQPIAGDWNGDGWDSVGVFDPDTGRVYLRDLSSGGPADVQYDFGPPRPPRGSRERMVAGDWDGN